MGKLNHQHSLFECLALGTNGNVYVHFDHDCAAQRFWSSLPMLLRLQLPCWFRSGNTFFMYISSAERRGLWVLICMSSSRAFAKLDFSCLNYQNGMHCLFSNSCPKSFAGAFLWQYLQFKVLNKLLKNQYNLNSSQCTPISFSILT